MLFAADIFDINYKEIMSAAICSELIHNASLLHDDVIDECTLRRGKSTVNKIWNNSIAVLGGNFLLSKAFKCLNNYDRALVADAVYVVSKMSESAIKEIELRSDLSSSIDSWRNVAIGKTGALFAWCIKSVALISNKKIHKLELDLINCIGNRIGVIFQLVDDLKDFKDDPKLKGKFNDLKNKSPSYPILLASKTNIKIKNSILNNWKKDDLTFKDIECLGNSIIESGIIDLSLKELSKEISMLKKDLTKYNNKLGTQLIIKWINSLYK